MLCDSCHRVNTPQSARFFCETFREQEGRERRKREKAACHIFIPCDRMKPLLALVLIGEIQPVLLSHIAMRRSVRSPLLRLLFRCH